MNLRMQGLHPSVHDFREAGVAGDFGHRQAGLSKRPAGAASGEDFQPKFAQPSSQFNQAGLVGHAEQGESRGHHPPIVSREGKEIVTCAAAGPGWGTVIVTGWAVSGASRRRRASHSASGGSASSFLDRGTRFPHESTFAPDALPLVGLRHRLVRYSPGRKRWLPTGSPPRVANSMSKVGKGAGMRASWRTTNCTASAPGESAERLISKLRAR